MLFYARHTRIDTGTRLTASNAELAATAPILISAVTADQAVAAAEQTGPHLTADHLYADLNSISPKAKEAVARAASTNGARFVEIAVMGPIPPRAIARRCCSVVPPRPEFQRLFEPLGMSMEIVATDRVGAEASGAQLQ